MKNYLLAYLKVSPFSLAFVRAVECRLLAKYNMSSPILDIGCGDGVFAKIFFNPAQKIYGLDMDLKEIELARISGAYHKVKIGDALDMPFQDNFFNTVFTNSVLEHTYSLPPILREVHRVLKPGGHFYVTIPSDRLTDELLTVKLLRRLNLNFLADFYAKSFNQVFKHNPRNLLNIKQWKKEFKRAKLNIVEYQYYNVHYLWFELLLPLAFHSFVWKKLTGKWVIYPKLRKVYAPWIAKLFYQKYLRQSSPAQTTGGSLLMVAQKV